MNKSCELRSFLDNMDFREVRPPFVRTVSFSPSAGSGNIRRSCFNVFLLDDLVSERTESFALDLVPEASTTGVRVDPNIAEVFILDNDGMLNSLHVELCLHCFGQQI